MSDIVVEPWPSDHRAVVSTFRVEPADARTFVAPLDVRVPIGQPVLGAFHAAPDPNGRWVSGHGREPRRTTRRLAVAGDGTSDATFELAGRSRAGITRSR
jgi:hypothetical protein